VSAWTGRYAGGPFDPRQPRADTARVDYQAMYDIATSSILVEGGGTP
jgi:hypothetical protein